MGLIQALKGATTGILADQWKEFFYCDALPVDVLVKKGQKRTSGRSSNTKGEENIISSGSAIAVADGQCMIILEQGKVVEVCAEPGEFIYDASTEPSIFAGNLGESIKASFKQLGKRFTFGGDTAKDQRVYYFNTKEILGNKYGTINPIPFRVVDRNIGLDTDVAVRCNGEYSYKLVDPILFYTNVCGNVEYEYKRDEVDSMLKSEILTALAPAFARISEMGVRYSALPAHSMEIADALNEILSNKWGETRGIKVASFGVNSATISKEDEDMIKNLQKAAVYRDPTMGAAALVGAQAQAMQDAAKNTSTGPMMAFAGMNMAQNAGGMNAQQLYGMGAQSPNAPMQGQGGYQSAPNMGFGAMPQQGNPINTVMGGMAMQGQPQQPQAPQTQAPTAVPVEGWTCSCGTVSMGKFCTNCGQPRPAGAPVYKCDKCGYVPEDPHNPPKFCPECGDPFNDEDKQ